MRNLHIIALCIGVTLCSAASRADDLASIEIVEPFGNPKAILSLKTYFEEKFGKVLTDKEALAFQSIDSINYSFLRSPSCDRKVVCGTSFGDVGDFVFVERSIVIDASSVEDAVFDSLRGAQKDGCSKFYIRNVRRALTQPTRITYTADLKAIKNTCYWFFGDQVTELASGEGSATVAVDLEILIDPADIKIASIKYIPRYPSINISDTDLLGFLDLDTFVGDIVTRLLRITDDLTSFFSIDLINLGINDALDSISKADFAINLSFDAAAAGSIGKSYQDFSTSYASSKKYWLSPSKTRNGDHGGRLILITSYEAVSYFSDFTLIIRPSILMEKAFIQSLSEDDREYLVLAGDSYYRITENFFGNGEIYQFLSTYNGEAALHPNDTISVPPFWKAELYFSDVVKPGDSLWGQFITSNDPATWDPKRIKKLRGSPSIDVIYPYQRYSDTSD